MVAKLIFGIVLPVFGLTIQSSLFLILAHSTHWMGRAYMSVLRKKVKTPIWLSMKRIEN